MSHLHAILGRHWPGWDDLWVVVVFALGVPAAAAAALRGWSRGVVAVTAAVWAWGGLLVLIWLGLG